MPLLLTLLLAAVEPVVGETVLIRRTYDNRSASSDGSSSGSSSGHETLKETVTAVSADGIELRYDLPDDARPDDRKREWSLPARIFYPREGQPRRVDRAEAEPRLADWMKRAKLDTSACGRWVFTWNIFKIECDPDAVIALVRPYQLRFLDAREGAPMSDPLASSAVPIRREVNALSATLSVDPTKLREERAESDVVVSKISGKAMTLEQALARRAGDQATGTITIRLEVGPTGAVQRRTRRISLETREESGNVETEQREEVTEVLSPADSRSAGLGPGAPSL